MVLFSAVHEFKLIENGKWKKGKWKVENKQ